MAAVKPPPELSIIVPVLNEAATIGSFLDALPMRCKSRPEVIVVDGGSNDATRSHALPRCDQLILSRPGRALQMNAGAKRAGGSILWFLHADSSLPQHPDRAITQALSGSQFAWGCFDVRLSGTRPMLRVVEVMMNWRSRLSAICTGDQGLFMTREAFQAVGGFPEISLMEDIAISRRLKSISRPARISLPLITSSRRWERKGIARTIVLMWKLRLLYFFGADPARLARQYYGRDD